MYKCSASLRVRINMSFNLKKKDVRKMSKAEKVHISVVTKKI